MIGESLRKIRELRKMTQAELGKLVHVAESTISGYESGHRSPSVKMVGKLANVLQVAPGDLLHDNVPIDKTVTSAENLTDGSASIPVGRWVSVPVVANISCGDPIFTEESYTETFPVDTRFVSISENNKDYFYLRASGNSMIGANIMDGNLVLMRKQDTCDSGDIAAVCVDDEAATLKRVYFSGDEVKLVPENPTMRDISYPRERVRVVAKALMTQTWF